MTEQQIISLLQEQYPSLSGNFFDEEAPKEGMTVDLSSLDEEELVVLFETCEEEPLIAEWLGEEKIALFEVLDKIDSWYGMAGEALTAEVLALRYVNSGCTFEGCFDSPEAFGREAAYQYNEISGDLAPYVDFKRYGSDLLEGVDFSYVEHDGKYYVWRN